MGPLGLEPRTNGLKVRCSNQLSYGPTAMVPPGSPRATGPCRAANAPPAAGNPGEMPERGLARPQKTPSSSCIPK